MSTLLEELTGRAYRVRTGVTGRKVILSPDEPTAEEMRKIEEAARKAAKKEKLTGNPKAVSRHLVMAALQDGRARFEADICELTTLRHATVANVLHRLRRSGSVEQHHVGTFSLWSVTHRRSDEPACD